VGVLALALAGWAAHGRGAGPITFGFESSSVGAFTPLTQTAGGVTARFSVRSGPGYAVQNAGVLFVNLSQFSGNFLYPNAGTVDPLTIAFSEAVTSITLTFATVEIHAASSMHLNAFMGATQVGSAIGPSALLTGDTYPQGAVTFSGQPFDRVEVWVPIQNTEPAVAFMIDTIVVNTVGPPAPVLRASWQLEENDGQTVTDGIGGFVGQLGSTPSADVNDPPWIPGRTGSGLAFDGAQYVAVATDPALSPSRITVEAWVKSPFVVTPHQYLLAKGANATCTAASYGLRVGNTGGLEFVVARPGGTGLVSPESPDIWDGRWHFVTGTFDGITAHLFVDGTELATGTTAPDAFSIDYSAPDQRLGIGSYLGGACGPGSLSFMGEIDQVSIWSGALAAAAVNQRYLDLNVPFSTDTTLTAAPSGTSEEGQPVDLTAVVMSSNGAATGTVEFLDGVTSLGSEALTGGVAHLTVTTLAAGAHTLSASFTPAGLFAASVSAPRAHTVAPATSPLTVALHTPTAPVTGVITLTATVSDPPSVKQVEFFADTVSVGVDTTAPFERPWNTGPLAHGSTVVLKAVATDTADRTVESPSVTVTIDHSDTSAPTVTITSPAIGGIVTGIMTVTADAADDRGVTRVEFAEGANGIGTDVEAPYAATMDTTHHPHGTVLGLFATAYDAAGNSTQSARVNVTVHDTSPPVVTVTGPATVEASGPTGAVVHYTATATDTQAAVPVVTCTPRNDTMFPLGATTITCTARDAGANVSLPATAIVSVVDTTAPEIKLPSPFPPVETEDPTGMNVTFVATATDAVDASPAIACTPASGSRFAVGTTPVLCTATDSTGNSVSASFVVTVTRVDHTPPTVVIDAPATVEATGPTGASVPYSLTVSDTQDLAPAATCTPVSGATFALGTTTIRCTATDASGNVSPEVTAPVEVVDRSAPQLTVPVAVTATATDPAGITVTYTVSASDVVDGRVAPICTPASGSVFSVGSTLVSCTATDAHANASSKTFTVTVTLADTMPPVVTVPAATTGEATSAAGAVVTFTATALDNVDGPIAPTCAPASGATFPLGATTVTCTATDSHGNSGTAGFTVAVVDTTPPQRPVWLPVTGVTSKVATLNWSAAPDLVGVSRYRIYQQIRKNAGVTAWQVLADGITGTSFTPPEFKQKNVVHTFVIVAIDRAGNESERSQPLDVDLPKPSGK
jgi:hypothetical protein